MSDADMLTQVACASAVLSTTTDASKAFTCDIEDCKKVYIIEKQPSEAQRCEHDINVMTTERFVSNIIGCSEAYYHQTKLISHLKNKHEVEVGKTSPCCNVSLYNLYKFMQ